MESTKNQSVNSRTARLAEHYIWLFFGLIIAARPLIMFRMYSPDKLLFEFYWELVLGFLISIFPIIFRLIFGSMPFEAIRAIIESTKKSQNIIVHGNYTIGSEKTNANKNNPNANTKPADISDFSSDSSPLVQFSSNSRNLAAGIYGRAGVYLLVGVIVAFSGLLFFYTQTASSSSPSDGLIYFYSLAPKIGILFFIEFIAFFFLKQYRSAMDEFRYYEAIARSREEVAALFILSKEKGTFIEPLELIKLNSYFSKAGLLAKGESTEIIESRKIEKNELDLLEKVVDTIAKSKK